MQQKSPKGEQVIAALPPPFSATRARGDNLMGISIRHRDLPRFLVCHIHVDDLTDEVTGFYFNCEKDIRHAECTAGELRTKMCRRPDTKHSGISPYITYDFSESVSLSELMQLIERANERHPRRTPIAR